MVLGIVCAVLLLLLCLKPISRKLGLQAVNRVLTTLHKPVGYLLLIMVGVHLILTISIWRNRPVSLLVIGFVLTGSLFSEAFFYWRRKRIGSSWLKYHRLAAVAAVLALGLHIAIGIHSLNEYHQRIGSIQLSDIDLSEIANGTYVGEEDAGYIYAKVLVTVSEGEITELKLLEHRNERGMRAEAVIDEIKETQTVPVDAVSGATNSSIVIEKAIENALLGR